MPHLPPTTTVPPGSPPLPFKQLSELEAGPELDSLVDEKIFGREYIRGYGALPYSTDIGAAWEVVEKMRNWPNGHWWLSLSQIAGVRGEWRAGFSFGGMAVDHSPKFVVADTAPLAICLAALKAIDAKT